MGGRGSGGGKGGGGGGAAKKIPTGEGITDKNELINLYNNDYIDTNKSREIAKILSNVTEDLNNPNDFAAYKKALSMATNKNGKYSPYTIGLILQYMIKKEFQKCAEELSDTTKLRKFQDFIEKHLKLKKLDDIKDKLVALKTDGNLDKFFGNKEDVKDETPKEKKTAKSTRIQPKIDYKKVLNDIENLNLGIDTKKLFIRDEEGNIKGVRSLFNQLKKVLKG